MRWIALASALIPAGIHACGDLLQEPDTGIATLIDLVAVSGGGQTGPPGATLLQPVRVRIVTLDGNPTERLWVEWAVLEGGGSVSPRHSFADANGIAETTWTLGSGPGRQRIVARFQAESETFDAQATGN